MFLIKQMIRLNSHGVTLRRVDHVTVLNRRSSELNLLCLISGEKKQMLD
jgi:hypothetical protein